MTVLFLVEDTAVVDSPFLVEMEYRSLTVEDLHSLKDLLPPTLLLDTVLRLDHLRTLVDIVLLLDLPHMVAVHIIMLLLDPPQDFLVPVLPNTLEQIRTLRHGLSSRTSITLLIRTEVEVEVVDGKTKNMA